MPFVGLRVVAHDMAAAATVAGIPGSNLGDQVQLTVSFGCHKPPGTTAPLQIVHPVFFRQRNPASSRLLFLNFWNLRPT